MHMAASHQIDSTVLILEDSGRPFGSLQALLQPSPWHALHASTRTQALVCPVSYVSKNTSHYFLFSPSTTTKALFGLEKLKKAPASKLH
jgi:hypothetical protein